jgi:hypothetical protein
MAKWLAESVAHFIWCTAFLMYSVGFWTSNWAIVKPSAVYTDGMHYKSWGLWGTCEYIPDHYCCYTWEQEMIYAEARVSPTPVPTPQYAHIYDMKDISFDEGKIRLCELREIEDKNFYQYIGHSWCHQKKMDTSMMSSEDQEDTRCENWEALVGLNATAYGLLLIALFLATFFTYTLPLAICKKKFRGNKKIAFAVFGISGLASLLIWISAGVTRPAFLSDDWRDYYGDFNDDMYDTDQYYRLGYSSILAIISTFIFLFSSFLLTRANPGKGSEASTVNPQVPTTAP